MKNTEKILLGIVFVLVITAVALTFMPKGATVPKELPGTGAARQLFINLAMVGYGQDDYYYSYTEKFNDFATTYGILKKGDEGMISIETVFSTKQVYFIENDTILCVQYSGEEACSSVHNETSMENYLESLRLQFFDEGRAEQTITDMEYFELYGYIIFSPETIEKTVDGKRCTEFSYDFDFTNITIYEAARFGIGATTPKNFHYVACLDNTTEDVYQKHVEYQRSGIYYTSDFSLISSEWGTSRTVEPPKELSGDAVELLLDEKTAQNAFAKCYEKEGNDRDKCIAVLALTSENKDLCDLAGERRDRCLVSIVPLTKDQSICPGITDMSFREDCYVEMGGATGDNSYCGQIANLTKRDFCLNITAAVVPEPEVPEPEVPELGTPDGGNSTVEDADVDAFLWEIYTGTLENDTNVTE